MLTKAKLRPYTQIRNKQSGREGKVRGDNEGKRLLPSHPDLVKVRSAVSTGPNKGRWYNGVWTLANIEIVDKKSPNPEAP